MPFARPTLAELVTRIRADIRGQLGIGGPLLRRAMADVCGAVFAGAVHLLYGYLSWVALQLFASTAEREALLRIAKLYGITPTPATFASGPVTVTGANGSVVAVGKVLRLNAAIAYSVSAGATISGGTATITVTAALAGASSNLPAGAALSFESPISGVNASATVATGGIIGGVNEEGTEEVRDRLRLRLRKPPQGGAAQDYEAWALAAPGVEKAWVYPAALGLGTVLVRVPDPSTVAAAQASLSAQRPITAVVSVEASTTLPVAFTIHISPDTADIRTAVAAELADLLARVSEPGDGAGRGRVLLSQIRTAIGVAGGVGDYTLISPTADVVPGAGQLPVVGTITWA